MSGPDLWRLGGALALGAAGGAIFVLLRLPLPWMLGAMTATMAASMSGFRFTVPERVRLPMLGILGVLLGSGFTLEVAAGMLRWTGSIAAIPIYILVSIGVGLLFLRRVVRLDPVTAFFGAAPGGLSEMVVLGDRAGGDMRTISLIHTTRIFVVVFSVPFIVRQLEQGGGQAAAAAAMPVAALELALLAVCLALGLWIGPKLRLPASFLLGPLLVSAVAHVSGLVTAAPPRLIVILAQIVIGTGLGARFGGVRLSRIAHTLVVGAAIGVLLLGVALATAVALKPLVGFSYAALLLAFSPGGVAEMGIVAVALGIDPLFVAAHHIVRISMVVLIAPWLHRWRGNSSGGTG